MPVVFDQIRGLADSKHSGIAGSVAEMVGIDIHSTPGLTKIQQALAKDSGATVDAFVRVSITASDGSTLWFSYTTGKIWRRTTSGTWTLEHTTTPAAGAAGCLGAREFDGFIYWATQSRLHRKPITDLTDWSDATEDWATFGVTDAAFHPMAEVSLKLLIGDGNQVAKVSGATGAHAFVADALDIKAPQRIKTMTAFDIDVLLGTFTATEVNKSTVIRWDTTSTSWQVSDPVEENGINAFIRDDNFVYVQAGQFGKFYFYNGEQLVPFKRLPGDWSPTKTGEVHPGSTTNLLGIPRFGFSNVAGNPANQGVYSLGSYSKDYPKVMDLSFPISEGSLTGLEIGAILAVGADLFVAWKVGAAFGVDKLNYSAKYASAYIETMILTLTDARFDFKTVQNAFANYQTLPASTDINFKYKRIHEASFSATVTSIDDVKLFQKRAELSIGEVAAFQLRLDFTVNSNDAPEVESVGYKQSNEEQDNV